MSILQINFENIKMPEEADSSSGSYFGLLNAKYREKYFENLHKKYVELVSIRICKYKTVVIFSKTFRL